jgi:hypothetical protein
MTLTKKIAASCFGVLSALALATPTFAQVNGGVIVQESDQTAIQEGFGNVSLQDSEQNADLHQMGWGVNGATINQNSDQFSRQRGAFNYSDQESTEDAIVRQDSGIPFYSPAGVNGAQVLQDTQQGTGQYGFGNYSEQDSDTSADIHQLGY